MILTVTLNAALDVTWHVDRLTPRSSHRVETAHERAGGKGINVARVLAFLGHTPVATGLAGGPTGRLIREGLHATGIRDEFVDVAGDSRRTLAVVSHDDGDATVFNGRGPQVTEAEWEAFRQHYASLLPEARVVVLSGSVPPGLPGNAYAQLIRDAAKAGAATVVDTSGPALTATLKAGPDVVKPNADEITAATGRHDLQVAAAALRAWGACTVVASAGPEGLYALTPDGGWLAKPPERLSGNPTGAGDACVAALAAGLAAGAPWADTLREAVALSAAAVPCPVAGDVDAGVYERFRRIAPVEVLPFPRDHPSVMLTVARIWHRSIIS
ncbi:1-phosphofructokinase family hexose kinase [Streptomyces sp. HNM0663]|uniref:1-phosphofructokinase family hexose kinase n=1 Tax=Streptomyces chengmaiensis TaxID=3040919 RepID=A0ABT6HU58_9ACTN|nr:1-phosphofructokinase family hexose kinase [Streptomyces chengmaiensis]MDH2391569.1 1-phosphofructokinase family hexose kinase [Streptomyces chengmaiensis]